SCSRQPTRSKRAWRSDLCSSDLDRRRRRRASDHEARADGRWRVYVFADRAAPTADASKVEALASWLESDPGSPLVAYRREGEDQIGRAACREEARSGQRAGLLIQ